jgi:hypothetical protein
MLPLTARANRSCLVCCNVLERIKDRVAALLKR